MSACTSLIPALAIFDMLAPPVTLPFCGRTRASGRISKERARETGRGAAHQRLVVKGDFLPGLGLGWSRGAAREIDASPTTQVLGRIK